MNTETTSIPASTPPPAPTPAIVSKSGAGYDLAKLVGTTLLGNGVAADLPGFHSTPLPDVSGLPGLVDGLELLVDQLIAIDPKDHQYNVKNLFINPVTGMLFAGDGGVWLEEEMVKKPGCAYTHTAAGQLLSFIETKKPQFSTANLCYYGPKPRHFMLEDLKARVVAHRKVTARTVRTDTGARVTRAFCSDTHTLDKGDTLAVAKLLRAKYGVGSKLAHTFETARINAVWSWDTSTIVIYFGEAGDKSRAVATLRLSETKQHSWSTSNGLYVAGRTYWGWQPAGKAGHGRHVGEQVANKMVDAIEEARLAADQVAQALDSANKSFLGIAGRTPQEELERIRRAFEVNSSLHEKAVTQMAIREDEELVTVVRYLDALIDVAANVETGSEQRAEAQRVVGAILQSLFAGEFRGQIG